MNATRTADQSSPRKISSALICSILMVSMLSATVLANDAGSGSDAGGNTSSSTYLPANNSTYYGNLTQGSDTDDYYAINMSSGTGISATITIPSNADFDLLLLASSGATIDSSTNGTGLEDHVTSNGTNVGGTTVYIWIDQYLGSGQYTLQIDIFSTGNGSGGGGGIGNDAGSGQDAGGSMSNALSVNITNLTTFQGNLSTSNDDDWYSMYIPSGYGIYIEMYHDTNADFDMWLYDSNGTQLDIAYTGLVPESVGSNGTDVSSSDIYLEIKDWPTSPSSGSYNVTLSLFSIIGNPAYNQNDSGSGGDAGDDALNATNLSIPQSTNSSSSFSGWKSSSDDGNDYYVFTVPPEHGVEINMTSTGVTGYLVLYWESNLTLIDSSLNNNGAEYVTSDGPEVSGLTVLMRAMAMSGGGYYNFTVTTFSLDTDNDGWQDNTEVQCGSDPEDYNSTPPDFDGDEVCDTMDTDDDNDGVPDADDDFPQDSSETTDTDNDGLGNNADYDDDGDGWNDTSEADCNTDPLDYSSQPLDTDEDSSCNWIDSDDDGDGYLDGDDDFPLDNTEWIDTDNDGLGNNIDTNDDSDGFSDEDEILCGSDPLSYSSVPPDSDSDGICDIMDDDNDDDGYPDAIDQFPNNPQEWLDTDSDGQGDNSDFDDDNDGVIDEYDAFDTDPNEQYDFDGDGVGDNADTDDDGDGWSDSDESTCQSNPQDSISLPDDFDSDNTCDIMDSDDDGDGYEDAEDAFQFDATEWEDTDSDGVGNNQDDDDDGDGWTDIIEPNCGADPLNAQSSPVDTDDDGTCDYLDPDNDNDSVMDVDDDFPEDQNESKDTDGDGVGNNADLDDDGDGWPDSSESLCNTSPLSNQSVPEDTDLDGNCDLLDMDDDNDGVPDSGDVFPKDVNEWEDLNNDGLGDNGYPLSLADRMKLSPGISALAILAILSLLGVLIYSTKSSEGRLTPISSIFSKKQNADQPPDNPHSEVENSPPPVPPGFEHEPKNEPHYAKSWEDLPPGGQYTDSVPMRYEGVDCGIWEQRDDESWVRK